MLLFLFIPSISWGQSYEEKVAVSKALIGKPVQAHTFYTLDKQSFSFQNLQGEFIVAYFFASWCSPCYGTLENLDKAIKNTPPTVRIVAVSLDEDWIKLKRMLAKTGFSGEVWKSADAKSVLRERLFANYSGSLPYIIRVDQQGILIEGGSEVKTSEQWSAIISQNASLNEASKI
nr:TlpA disulfide reductase family protein [Alteromonas ponticola]